MLERCYELPLLARRYAARRLVERIGGARVHLLENRLRLWGQIELHCAPIERVHAALDPARALHAVDEPRQRDRLDLEALGESRLGHAFAARQMHDRAPLGLRETQRLQAPVHAAPKEAGDVRHEKTQGAVDHDCGRHSVLEMVSMLMISLLKYRGN